MDDAILGSTAPVAALYLSYVHGLPRATHRVAFEKDLRMPLPRRKGEKERHSLSFMLIHPADSGRRRRYPTILVRNPYGRLSFFFSFYLFAQVRPPVRPSARCLAPPVCCSPDARHQNFPTN